MIKGNEDQNYINITNKIFGFAFFFIYHQVSNNGFIRFGTSIADANSPVCFDFMSQDNFPYDGLFSLLGIQLTSAVNDDALIYIE